MIGVSGALVNNRNPSAYKILCSEILQHVDENIIVCEI